jgi:hypothetical protein
MNVSLLEIHQIWKQHLGFVPTALATFDHMATGFPSRLVTGYATLVRFCAEKSYDPFRAVSIVLDSIVARREDRCGLSPELGYVASEHTQWVEDSSAFFFRTRFHFDFVGVRPLFEKEIAASLVGVKKLRRFAYYREAMGWYSLIAHLWSKATTCADVVQARRDLLSHLGVCFKGKHILHSDLLAVEADILEYLISCGVNLDTCPGVEKTGVARVLDERGHEYEVLAAWDPAIITLLRNKEEKKLVLTTPLALLVSSLLFPHFGRDYGMLPKIASWLGVEVPVCETHDSWHIGELKAPRAGGSNCESLRSLWADLFYWGGAKYARLIEESLETGKPVFSARLCDWPKE